MFLDIYQQAREVSKIVAVFRSHLGHETTQKSFEILAIIPTHFQKISQSEGIHGQEFDHPIKWSNAVQCGVRTINPKI